jgi:hypothetical protein
MPTLDEAKQLAMQEFRTRYPAGSLVRDLEENACYTMIPKEDCFTLVVSFCLRGQRKRFILFQADVDRFTGKVVVSVTRDARLIQPSELDKRDYAT